MKGEKVTKYDQTVFKNSCRMFTYNGGVLKTITDYKFNTTHSPDAKILIDNMNEMLFHIHSRGKF